MESQGLLHSFKGTRAGTRKAIFDFARSHASFTKIDVASQLGISVPTVAKYLSKFVDEGLLEENGKVSSGSEGGRSPMTYISVPSAKVAVGVDINQERAKVAIVDLAGHEIFMRRMVEDFTRSHAYIGRLADFIRSCLLGENIRDEQVLGVGIAMPGLINPESETVAYGKVIDNSGMRASDFEQYIRFPSFLIHDSAAAGLAVFMSGEFPPNAFYIGLNRSVGGSIIIDSKIYLGDLDVAGEIGHMKIVPDGRICYCGKKGCLDAYCNSALLSEVAGGQLDDFFAMLKGGEPAAVQAWDMYTDVLAVAVHNVRLLFGCDVILGGEVGAAMGGILSPFEKKIDALAFHEDPASSFVVAPADNGNLTALGAALFLINRYNEDPASAAINPY